MPDPAQTVENALAYVSGHPELPEEAHRHVDNLAGAIRMLETRLAGATDQNGALVRQIVGLKGRIYDLEA